VTSAPHSLEAVSPVPSGSSVLHIGPHKTGTSALQEAMRLARADLLAQDVRLVGLFPGDADGIRHAITGRTRGNKDAAARAWERIKTEMNDDTVPRRVYSRETFANASPKRARRILEQFGFANRPFHVVMSARSLAQLVPSQYSQFVQRGMCQSSFEDWVKALLADDGSEQTVRLFWRRHSHDAQLRLWGSLVGFENVTVIVVDPREPLFLPHVFERLLDLRPGTLADHMGHDRGNRSLTLAELDLIRRWHEITAPTGADRGDLTRLMWQLAHHLRRYNPTPVDPRPTLPDWAIPEITDRANASMAAIASSGAHVVGDLDALAAVPTAR
jgi:hypothetical protein